jgi:hypothetical protein
VLRRACGLEGLYLLSADKLLKGDAAEAWSVLHGVHDSCRRLRPTFAAAHQYTNFVTATAAAATANAGSSGDSRATDSPRRAAATAALNAAGAATAGAGTAANGNVQQHDAPTAAPTVQQRTSTGVTVTDTAAQTNAASSTTDAAATSAASDAGSSTSVSGRAPTPRRSIRQVTLTIQACRCVV